MAEKPGSIQSIESQSQTQLNMHHEHDSYNQLRRHFTYFFLLYFRACMIRERKLSDSKIGSLHPLPETVTVTGLKLHFGLF